MEFRKHISEIFISLISLILIILMISPFLKNLVLYNFCALPITQEREFCISFSTNFAATIFGLIFGIPISLWLVRQTTSLQEMYKRKEEQQRLVQTIDMLSQSFSRNRDQMESLIDTVRKGWGKENLEIDYSSWDAVKSEVVQYLHNPSLQYRLSHHFSRMKYLVKVSDMYTDYKFGVESATISRKRCKRIVDALVEYLLSLPPELINEANELKCDIQKEMIKIQNYK